MSRQNRGLLLRFPERLQSVTPHERAEPSREPKPHLLKNGHAAHVFTTDDRRKGAAATNAIRRARRMAAEDEKFERAVAEMIARDEARKARKREMQRLRDRRRRAEQSEALSGEPLAASMAEAQRRNCERGHAYGPDLSGLFPTRHLDASWALVV